MTTETVISDDLSSVTREDGMLLILPAYDPRTMRRFASEDEVRAAITEIAALPGVWSNPPPAEG